MQTVKFTPEEDGRLLDFMITNVNSKMSNKVLLAKFKEESNSTRTVTSLALRFRHLACNIHRTYYALEVKAAILKKHELCVDPELSERFEKELGMKVNDIGYLSQHGQVTHTSSSEDLPESQQDNPAENVRTRNRKKKPQVKDHQEGTSSAYNNHMTSEENQVSDDDETTGNLIPVQSETSAVAELMECSSGETSENVKLVNVLVFLKDFKRIFENINSPEFDNIKARIDAAIQKTANEKSIEVDKSVLHSTAEYVLHLFGL